MKQLIRIILKEESLKKQLMDIINKETVFGAALLVGDIENLKFIFFRS